MTLADFSHLTENRLNWTKLVTLYTDQLSVVSPRITDAEHIIVSDIPYFQAMTKLLLVTPPHIIRNYMGWLFVTHYNNYFSRKLYEIGFEYSKEINGVKEDTPYWRKCLIRVSNQFSIAIGRLYVDRFVKPNSKEISTQMINNIKESFRQIIQTSKWLDDATRVLALEKLSAILDHIEYPDWILDNDELDKQEGLLGGTSTFTVEKGKFFESKLRISQLKQINSYRQLRLPVNLTTE